MYVYTADEMDSDITEITSVSLYVPNFSSTTLPTGNSTMHCLIYETPATKIQVPPNRFPPQPI
jgi:hypothetical protein